MSSNETTHTTSASAGLIILAENTMQTVLQTNCEDDVWRTLTDLYNAMRLAPPLFVGARAYDAYDDFQSVCICAFRRFHDLSSAEFLIEFGTKDEAFSSLVEKFQALCNSFNLIAF